MENKQKKSESDLFYDFLDEATRKTADLWENYGYTSLKLYDLYDLNDVLTDFFASKPRRSKPRDTNGS